MRSAFRAAVTSSGEAGLRNCAIVGFPCATVRVVPCACRSGVERETTSGATTQAANDERVMEQLRGRATDDGRPATGDGRRATGDGRRATGDGRRDGKCVLTATV